jgi:arthrofactin-type cyclic lipopeptide synthetase C
MVGILGVLKAGGAYVPLDPAYPAERFIRMLEDSAPVAVLRHAPAQPDIGSTLAAAGAPVVALEADAERWESEPETNPDPSSIRLTPEHPAYVIYTSGSTGRPKGVMNEHRAVVNRLLWMQEAYGLDARDAVLQKTPFSFDVSVWEFFWPLLNGAKLVMARVEGHKDPAYLTDVIERQRITTAHFVPSMMQVFLDHGDVSRCASLARVICSGEALPGSLARRFRERLPHAGLHNLYGPTEAAVDVTAWACSAEALPDNIPIGRPIANTQIYLLDGHGRPAPVGVVGELHIAGIQVARGYLKLPELTAERFVPNPFREEPGARLYRTGDLARYLPDGAIEFLGRSDHQVKVRGARIELGEIEAALSQHPAVREAVVVARRETEDVAGDKRLVAYLVSDQHPAPTAGALRAFLKERVPEYMTPSVFVTLDALPLTPNGKVDRRALPAPEKTRPDLESAFAAPRNPIEETLAEIVAQILWIEKPGIHDNFFELGGHSLLATQFISRVRNALQVELPLRSVFTGPTIAELAEAIEKAREDGVEPRAPAMKAIPRETRRVNVTTLSK